MDFLNDLYHYIKLIFPLGALSVITRDMSTYPPEVSIPPCAVMLLLMAALIRLGAMQRKLLKS